MAESVTKKPKVMFVCERPPEPNSSGAASYNWSVLEAIRAMTDDIDLVISGDHFASPLFPIRSVAVKGVNATYLLNYRKFSGYYVGLAIKSYLRPVKRWLLSMISGNARAKEQGALVQIGRFSHQQEIRRLQKRVAAEQYDVVFIDTIFRSPLLGAFGRDQRSVLVAHDLFHQRCLSFKANGYRVSPWIDRDQERNLYLPFNAILAINQSEADEISRLVADVAVKTLLPTVSGRYQQGAAERRQPTDVFYVGANAHHNVDGLNWFFSSVWPAVIDAVPEVHLHIVGSVCDGLGEDYPNVIQHGRVDDLAAIAHQSSFAINPVKMGSGIKIKMVDYFNLGLPCITTDVGGYGFPMKDTPPFLATETAQAFVDAMVGWLTAPEQAERYRQRTAAYVGLFSAEQAALTIKTVMSDTPDVAVEGAH